MSFRRIPQNLRSIYIDILDYGIIKLGSGGLVTNVVLKKIKIFKIDDLG